MRQREVHCVQVGHVGSVVNALYPVLLEGSVKRLHACPVQAMHLFITLTVLGTQGHQPTPSTLGHALCPGELRVARLLLAG